MFLIFSFLLLFLFLIKNFYCQQVRPLPLLFLFFSLGILAHFLNSKVPELPHLKSKENIVFKINKKLNSNEKNRRYEITAWKDKESFLSVLSLPKSEKDLDFSHYYKAEAYINTVKKPYSDFQFDYGKYLARKAIYFQSYLPDSFQIAERKDLTFAEKIREKRLETLSKIDHANFSKKAREFTKGIILSDRTEMDDQTIQDFSKSGLMHVLAISGSHMVIIFWLILVILKPVFPARFRNYKIIISLLLIWAFGIFIDYGSSVVRSCIMISVYYIYVLLQRKPDLLHSMAVAAFGILIVDTNQFFDVGFQLSFIAVFGIFWLNKPILKHLPKPKNTFQNNMVNIISVSVSAQIATLPLVVFTFHQYSVISIVANLVVIPFSEILIIFSLLMTFIIAFSIKFTWLNLMYDFCVTYALKLIHFFADFDVAFQKMIPMTLLEVVVAFIIIYFLRAVVLKFNIKNSLKVTYFILTFVALRFILNFKANQINEILVHQYFKEKIVSVKQNDKVKFVVRENSNSEKIEKYVIEPYLTSRRTKFFEIVTVSKSAEHIQINGIKYDLK
ncbi:ComEC/Rec2 family competence protein [Chryseobacterium gotjawalense]|uniref:ComEC/Rec2 family competence protein n=1 Tax=Chryseobacterium gotjawalense TaxID=3042315 RepID=A0ABY8RDK5_9FLAO|nr:ComEC/Rec2 family competence protein [Chryseobacterium sp. wdc7]WHF51127.1 ComEC/Rec2 family competence protein [Chryseobacterium sp. wdc7]